MDDRPQSATSNARAVDSADRRKLEMFGRGLAVAAGTVAVVFGLRLLTAPNPVVWIHPALGVVAIAAALRRPEWLLGLGILSFVAYGWYLVLVPMPAGLVGMAGFGYMIGGELVRRDRARARSSGR